MWTPRLFSRRFPWDPQDPTLSRCRSVLLCQGTATRYPESSENGSVAIVVYMDQIVMVAAQVLAAVAAELCGWLGATFLMLLQFIWTAESADVADFYLLTRLQCRIESDIRARNRFDDGWMSRLCPGASMSLALCVRLRFGTRFRF